MKKNDLDNLANKLNDILTKAKNESDEQNKKDFFHKLKKDNDIANWVEKLDYIFNKNPKRNSFDVLKKIRG